MINNLILLTGTDDFRLHERSRFYRKAFQKKYQNGEIKVLTSESSFADLENPVLTPNLFGEKRCVFLESFWNPKKFERAEKTKFFEKLPEMLNSVSVICLEPSLDKRMKWSKFLLKNTKIETFDSMDEFSLLQWISEYAKKNGGIIKQSEARILLTRCGENLWNLSHEIDKLVMSSENEVSSKLIKELTIPHPKAIIWEFTESLSKKNLEGAMRCFNQLLEAGESIHQILAMIFREVRIHAQLKSALELKMPQGQIAKETKLHPFVIQKTLPLSRNFSFEMIEQMYDWLFEIDRKMKTGRISMTTDDTGELALAIEKFVIGCCRK